MNTPRRTSIGSRWHVDTVPGHESSRPAVRTPPSTRAHGHPGSRSAPAAGRAPAARRHWSRPEQGRAQHRRRRRPPGDRPSGRRLGEQSRDPVVQLRVPGRQHAAAQHHRRLLVQQVRGGAARPWPAPRPPRPAGRTSERATGSPAAAVANSTGVSSCAPGRRESPRCRASISAYIDVEPEVRGQRAGQRGRPRRGRPRPAPRTTAPPPRGPSRRPSRRRSGRARGSGRCGRRGSMPTQLMPAPQTTATPRGSSTPGAQQREGVVARPRPTSPQPRAVERRASSRSSSTGRSALARQAETCRPAAAAAPRPRPRAPRRPASPSTSTRRVHARRSCGWNAAAARRGRAPCRPAPTSATSVLLLPAVDGERPRAVTSSAHGRCSRLCASSRSVSRRRARPGRPAGGRAAPRRPGPGRRAAPRPGPGPRTP